MRDDPGVRNALKLDDRWRIIVVLCPRDDPLIAGHHARIGSNKVLLIRPRPVLERITVARLAQFVLHRLDTHRVVRVEELNEEDPVSGRQIECIVRVCRIDKDVRVEDVHLSHHLEMSGQFVEHFPLVCADHTETFRESRTPLQGGSDNRGRK